MHPWDVPHQSTLLHQLRAQVSEDLPTAEALYELYANVVARWAFRLGGPRLPVDDVVQQVFLLVHKQVATLRIKSSVRAWLFGITQNEVRQWARREHRRRLLQILTGQPEEPIAEGTPHEDLERVEATRRLYRVLDKLPEKYRSVLVLHQLEQLSGEEIADLTGLKIGAVWVRLHRARALFLKALESTPEDGR